VRKIFIFTTILFLFISCGNNEQSYLENCGDPPFDFVEIEIGNDPNFIFKNDPEFTSILLNDEEGNTVTVNSYLECTHYIKGGWFNPNILSDSSNLELKSKTYLSIIVAFSISISYMFFNNLRKNNINIKNILNYSPLIFCLFAIANIYLKILNRGIYFPTFEEGQIFRYISLALGSLFLFQISKLVNNLIKIESISLSISYYLLSFFIFDLALLPITKFISFSTIFAVVNFLWIVTYFVKFRDIKLISMISFSYIALITLNKNNKLELLNENYKVLNADVTKQWLPIAESIHNNNLFNALEINLIDGYGMLLSYTQAVINKLLFNNEIFIFNTVESNLVFVLSIFLFLDLKISKINRFILFVSYFLIVLDDGWLMFILANSLMLEGIVSFLFASFIINFYKLFDEQYDLLNKILFLIFFSSLAFSKQFIEILAIFLIILFFIYSKKRLILLFSGILLILDNIYKNLFFENANSIEYFDGSFTDLIKDIIFLRDANWENMFLIFNKLFEFKFVLFSLLLIAIFQIFNIKNSDRINTTILTLIVFINLSLVLLLYLFIWKNVETDSSFRYIMNTSHLIFISLFSQFDSFQKKIKIYSK